MNPGASPSELAASAAPSRQRMVSVITPAFNEAANLPDLWNRLRVVMDATDLTWEWIIIDDHSTDATFDAISSLAVLDNRVRAYRFSRNFGSHVALACGLERARGDCAVVMASDLQDPPEILPSLMEKWSAGAHIVWAVRRLRRGEKRGTVLASKLFYLIMRYLVGIKEMGPTGADFLLMDRVVIDALNEFQERNVSLMALITWMGFRQDQVEYDKQARFRGKSGWSLEKRLKAALDAITSFTYLPIRAISCLGFTVALCGFTYAVVVVVNSFLLHPIQGWSSLMVVVLVLGGAQMLMLGVLGEYLWRAFDESRRRPRYIIERLAGNQVLAARSHSSKDNADSVARDR